MLRRVAYELGRGFCYPTIRHPEFPVYTRWLPLGLAAALIVAYALIPVDPVLLGSSGAFAAVLALLSTLPGFYFAGLAAVATFGAPTMDLEMPPPAPEVDILVGAQKVSVKLTRRLFLTYLFSYLVLVSFILCAALLAMNVFQGSIELLREKIFAMVSGRELWRAITLIVLSPLAFLLSAMVVTTLHGIYFLVEKIHQP